MHGRTTRSTGSTDDRLQPGGREGAALVDNVDSNDPDLKRSYNGFEINFNARLPQGARLFGGTSTERTVSNTLQRGRHQSEPARSSAIRRKNGIPFTTSFKLAVHLSRCRGTASPSAARCRRWPAACSATTRCPTACSRPAPASTNPNGRGTYLLVTPTTNWTAATCKSTHVHDRPARHPGHDPGVAQRPAGGAADRIHAAPESGRLRVQQVVQRRPHAHQAEAGHLQRVQLGRLHRREHRCSTARPPTSGRRRFCRAGSSASAWM